MYHLLYSNDTIYTNIIWIYVRYELSKGIQNIRRIVALVHRIFSARQSSEHLGITIHVNRRRRWFTDYRVINKPRVKIFDIFTPSTLRPSGLLLLNKTYLAIWFLKGKRVKNFILFMNDP